MRNVQEVFGAIEELADANLRAVQGEHRQISHFRHDRAAARLRAAGLDDAMIEVVEHAARMQLMAVLMWE